MSPFFEGLKVYKYLFWSLWDNNDVHCFLYLQKTCHFVAKNPRMSYAMSLMK